MRQIDMFIVQRFIHNKWQDISKHKSYEIAKGNAWEMSLKNSIGPYRSLTRVIVKNETILCRYGQAIKII